MIGLHAGPVFVEAVREVGIGLLVAGAFVTLVPQFVGLFVGRYVLRMNPLMLLGALSGAQTMTAAVPFSHMLLIAGRAVMVWFTGCGLRRLTDQLRH